LFSAAVGQLGAPGRWVSLLAFALWESTLVALIESSQHLRGRLSVRNSRSVSIWIVPFRLLIQRLDQRHLQRWRPACSNS